MSIFKRLFGSKKEVNNLTLKEVDGWSSMMARTGSGISVTEESALSLSSVYACVRILSETIAGLPVKVYQRTPSGRQEVDHPISRLLNVTPNDTQTAFELTEYIMASLGLRGNAFTQKIRNARGQLVALEPLQAGYIRVEQQDGGLRFAYNAPGNVRTFSADEIWRIAGLSSNGVTGLSPIGMARESLGIAAAADASAARMYSNGAQIPGVLEFPGKLNDDVLEHLRKQWAENQAGSSNAFKPLILESNMKYSQIGMNAKDAQFLEARKFQISEVARWYRVPLHKLGELDRATFSNIEHQSIEFVTDTILPWVRRIEQTIQRDLMTPEERRTLFVRFNLEGLMRGDTQTRYEAYGKAINDGWLSRNEVRKLENMNPADGLDEYLVPLNMGTNGDMGDRVANWIASREINALNNAKQDDLQTWAADFYQRQAETLNELTGMAPEECAAYAVKRIETVTQGGLQAAKKSAIQSLREAVNG